MRTVLTQFEARVVHLSYAPYDQLLASQVSYLLLGRWSTDRPRTPCTNVSGHCYVQTRSGMTLFFIAQLLASNNGRFRITSARHEEASVSGRGRHSPVHRVSGSELRRLRTHRLSGRARPLRSTVVKYQAPSVAVGHQLCARTGQISGHSRHPVMLGLPPAHMIPRTMSLGQRSQMWYGTPISLSNYLSRSKDWLDNTTVRLKRVSVTPAIHAQHASIPGWSRWHRLHKLHYL